MRLSPLLLCMLIVGGCAGGQTAPGALLPVALTDSLLRPGDVLRVTVWRQPEFSGEFVINPDSTVAHPLLQAVKVAGVPPSVARGRLRDFLAAYEQNPRFVVEPLYPVVAAGEVHQPGLFTVPRGTTVSQAVARAGGPTELGQLDKVKLIRGGRTLELNLLSQDQRVALMPIMSGDQLLVGRRSQFNVLRDLVLPLTSLAGTITAIAVARRR